MSPEIIGLISTLSVALIIGVVLFLAGRKLWKDRKSGKSTCGGNCASCGCCCHKEKQE